jgi:hypothetical protein
VKRVFFALFWLASGACKNPVEEVAPAGRKADSPQRVEVIQAGPGSEEATAVVKRELLRAQNDGRKLLVYVGAPWCEPCTRFHDAAAAGRLDAVFPGLRLLEFDHDRDAERLARAGCVSAMIPLFARPEPDGRCSQTARIQGSIKGDGAVSEIKPRLTALLSSP